MTHTVKVYHLDVSNDRELRFKFDVKRGDELVKIVNDNLDKYKLVAEPESEGARLSSILEDAYRMTNSVDEAWYKNYNNNPTAKASSGCRSTSVGDILVFNNTKYVVDSYGFKPLDID